VPKEPEAGAMKEQAPAGGPERGDKPPEVDIEVADASGKVIRRFQGPAVLGLNRTSWDLKSDPFKRPTSEEESEFRPRTGPEVLPGDYTVTVRFRDAEAKQTVRVLPDPRERTTAGQRQQKHAALMRAGALQETATEAIERIRRTRTDIDAVAAKLKKDDEPGAKKEPEPLVKSGADLKKKLDALERTFWRPPGTKGIAADTDAMSKINYPMFAMQSSWDAPTPAQLAYLERAEAELKKALEGFHKLFAEDVARYREEVRKASLVLLPEDPELKMP
jgi:hypothetical protein